MTPEQDEVIRELCSNTHTLWTTAKATKMCAAFGLVWRPRSYQAGGGPKGLFLDNGAASAEGAASWDVSASIASHLGARPEGMLGRGFQVRADCKAILDKLSSK